MQHAPPGAAAETPLSELSVVSTLFHAKNMKRIGCLVATVVRANLSTLIGCHSVSEEPLKMGGEQQQRAAQPNKLRPSCLEKDEGL